MFLVDWFYGVLASLGLWQKEAKILLLGTDVEGRARLLHMLNDEPTAEELSSGKIKFKAFDLGGYQMARRVLRDYHAQVDAVVYLVDEFNKVKLLEYRWRKFGLCHRYFEKSREELHALLSDESLANVPFLILGNMIDIPYTASEEDLCYCFGLAT